MATPVSNVVGLSGDARIDGLVQGSRWQFSGGNVITYSLSLNDDLTYGSWSGNPQLATAVRAALAAWSQVANITFVESGSGTLFLNSTADIALTLTGDDLAQIGAVGLGIFPSPQFATAFLADTEYN